MARRPRKAEAAHRCAVAGPEAVGTTLALEGTLDLGAAAPLRAELLRRRGSDLAVNASAVRHLGGLCAQVLASAATTWAGDGRSIRFQSPSEAFVQGVRLLGLGDVIEIGA